VSTWRKNCGLEHGLARKLLQQLRPTPSCFKPSSQPLDLSRRCRVTTRVVSHQGDHVWYPVSQFPISCQDLLHPEIIASAGIRPYTFGHKRHDILTSCLCLCPLPLVSCFKIAANACLLRTQTTHVRFNDVQILPQEAKDALRWAEARQLSFSQRITCRLLLWRWPAASRPTISQRISCGLILFTLLFILAIH
jgi:hypothetical protein